MKFSVVAVILAGLSTGALAQSNTSSTYKVKHSTAQKDPKSHVIVPPTKPANTGSTQVSSTKDLQTLEHQTAKASAPPRAGGKKAAGARPIKPVKDKSTPPINFGGTTKRTGNTGHAANPYSRVKQKGSH
jgi:hypothetical protein